MTRWRTEWDAVLTCFFIDTARNIVDYLERIFYILKPGGVWINLGPTLWHWENNSEGMSIEILGDDIKALATRLGFIITVRHLNPPARAATLTAFAGGARDCNDLHEQSQLHAALRVYSPVLGS